VKDFFNKKIQEKIFLDSLNQKVNFDLCVAEFFLKFDPTIGEFRFLAALLLAVVGVVLDTTVSDLCHWLVLR